MNESQLRVLIYDLYCNNPKLRKLSKDGLLTMYDLWDMQDTAVDMAKKTDKLSE